MKMPEFTIENHKKIYEYLRQYPQNKKLIRYVYSFVSFVLNPRIHYAKGACKDLDKIRDKDCHHIYVVNHRGDNDGFMYWAIVHKIMPSDEGRVRLLTHSMGYESPLARLCRNLGTIPVFLKIYYKNANKHKNHPERLALIPDAAQSMFDCLVCVMTEHRQKLFIFPEGEFNTGARDTILPVRKGTAVVAQRVAQYQQPVAITPIGLAYGKMKHRFDKPFRASIYVNRPIFVAADMTVEEITKQVYDQLENSVKEAVRLY